MMNKFSLKISLLFCIVGLLTACTVNQQTVIPSPTTITSIKTITPTHQPTFTEEILSTSTVTPSPKPTVKPTHLPSTTATEQIRASGRLIFTTFDDAWGENIYMVDASCIGKSDACNSNWVQLTNIPWNPKANYLNECGGDQLTASPDGKYLAFSYRTPEEATNHCDEGWDIYKINIEECSALIHGCGPKKFIRLTDDKAADTNPAWSPDGKRIAFISDKGPYEINANRLYTMNIDGSEQKLLLPEFYAGQPHNLDWSPDGKSIVFSADNLPEPPYRGGLVIYSADVSSLTIEQLTTLPKYENDNSLDHFPQWSPDGHQIVFVSNRALDSATDLYLMKSDGSEMTRYTSFGYWMTGDQWSPDSKNIAFSTMRSISMVTKKDGVEIPIIADTNIGLFIWIP
jgi:Tol biopolymer transport system component